MYRGDFRLHDEKNYFWQFNIIMNGRQSVSLISHLNNRNNNDNNMAM